MREFVPKSLAPKRTKMDKKKAKRLENQRAWKKEKAERDFQKKRRDWYTSEVGIPMDQRDLLMERVNEGKRLLYEFHQRTGRVVDIDFISRLNQRQGKRVVDYLPGGNATSITMHQVPPFHAKQHAINRPKGQKIARELRIPYYREMKMAELRGIIALLLYKDGIDQWGQGLEV